MSEDNLAISEFLAAHPVQMEPDEIAHISQAIRGSSADCTMIEWGSGASTVKWLTIMENNQKLISIEHDKNWFDRVARVINTNPNLASRHEYFLREPAFSIRRTYGQPDEENPSGMDKYLIPDDKIFDADIYLIDGVARSTCALLVMMKATKTNPIIYIHDWYHRQPWYSCAVNLYPKSLQVGTTLVQLTLH